MLTSLRIQNFAIIDQIELELGPGLSVFTGETGAGKSIIMDALDMLLGGRTDVTSIRAEADLAQVEGTFDITGPEREAVTTILQREDLLDDDHILTVGREIRRGGRSSARRARVAIRRA